MSTRDCLDTTPSDLPRDSLETTSTLRYRRREAEDELQQIEAESVSEALAEGFNADVPEKFRTTLKKRYFKKQTTFILLNIINGSVWGVLARKGVMTLTTYPGAYLEGVVWANFGACLIMGLLVDSSRIWEGLIQVGEYDSKSEIPLYTGFTTGFCGTFSSFSTFISDVFTKSSNTEAGVYYDYPNSAYGIMEFLAVILAQMGISILGYFFGKHIIEIFDDFFPKFNRKTYRIIEFFSMALGVIAYIINCILIGVKREGEWRSWTFSILFAPFGAVLRFYLSKFLNPRMKNFPLGTFAANFIGCIILATLDLLSRGKLPKDSESQIVTSIIGCHILTGLEDGFCGALTTVSTFVVELFGLKTLYTYRYGFVSIFSSYVIFVLILGVYNWKVGLTNAIC